MWNKKTTISGLSAFIFLFAFSAFPKDGDQETDDGLTAKAAQPQVQTTSGRPARFDPKTPQLTMKAIKKLLEVDIQKNLLEKKLPEEFSKVKDRSEIPSRSDFHSLYSKYTALMNNPELIEVTRVHPNWYKAYDEKLQKFTPVIEQLEYALNCRSANQYFLTLQIFKKLQEECLIFLKEPPSKISKEQYAALHKANTKQRALNYEKLMKERRAAELKAIQAKKAKAAKSSSKTSE